MCKEEIIKKQEELSKELMEINDRFFRNIKYTGNDRKRLKEIVRELQNLQRELDKLNGDVYKSEKWITSYMGFSYKSLKDARLNLVEQIKGLPGVKVGTDKSGVVGVSVYTEHKIYHYTIHAHYRVEVIGEHEEEGMFGKVTRQETRQVYQANIESNGSHWTWRY